MSIPKKWGLYPHCYGPETRLTNNDMPFRYVRLVDKKIFTVKIIIYITYKILFRANFLLVCT